MDPKIRCPKILLGFLPLPTWRFDPCEIAPGGGQLLEPGAQKQKPREPLVEECVTDDEFYE